MARFGLMFATCLFLKDHVILFLNITDNITTLSEREFIL